MIITSRDKSILRFVEQYGSITINQCSKIFFKGNKYAYYQARRRLRLLSDNKQLNRYRKGIGSQCIYYLDKKLSEHKLKVLDIYAELLNMGVEIQDFKQEYVVCTKSKEYRIDALIECEYNGYFYPLIIEIDYTHFTAKSKLDGIYNSHHFQDKYKVLDDNIFPLVIIARVTMPVNIIETEGLYNIFYTEFDFQDIKNILD